VDAEPLKGKRIGIWSFDCGIIVARTRISSEKIKKYESPLSTWPEKIISIYTDKDGNPKNLPEPKPEKRTYRRRTRRDPKKVVPGLWEPVKKKERQKNKKVKWVKIFSDDFSKNTLKEKWLWPYNEWKITNGKLKACSQDSHSTILPKCKVFDGDFRIEYEAKTLAGYEGAPCDMSFAANMLEVNQTTHHVRGGYGYLFRVASHANKVAGISRSGELITNNKKFLPAKLKTNYKILAERANGYLRMTIDGKEVFYGKDKEPRYKNDKNRCYGVFYTFKSIVEFDNVKISVPEGRVKEIKKR
jgi:hypothetical protein